MDASDADAAIVRMQLKQDWGPIGWTEIDTSKRSGSMDEQATSEAEAAEILNLT